ncbi:hypothetical protein GCM10010365_68510 [Streptomyces poonensis]|uniref:Uncharacterized protein n=1 Tax=Streptomyces poonensis TaxID=68255 RepID=A0A918Q9D5_9ACTN|nr:hypothetical protein [Streptomyces poonensis]GGZ38026.1 hypothetical protein GCM10010365_68510 [Streptomyces poonensis]GLJ91089.1 hypothetical protein GCM10017589_36950 [Streptomyces poonensis]
MRWQIAHDRQQFGRERLDLVLLRNPERAHPGDRTALHHAIRDVFAVAEEAAAAGRVTGYGVATWAGPEEAFTVEELLALAAEAVGGTEHHLVAVQTPVSATARTTIQQDLARIVHRPRTLPRHQRRRHRPGMPGLADRLDQQYGPGLGHRRLTAALDVDARRGPHTFLHLGSASTVVRGTFRVPTTHRAAPS